MSVCQFSIPALVVTKKHCTHACLCQSVYDCFISCRH